MISYFVFYGERCFYRNAIWKISCDSYERAVQVATDYFNAGYMCDVWSVNTDTKRSEKILFLK